jgi:alkylation response protein AidB-like acyl-CoA dehydrogenase
MFASVAPATSTSREENDVATSTTNDTLTRKEDWTAVARKLGPAFAARAPGLDANDSFGAENFRELKESRVFSAGVPAELGGGGASHAELCDMLRELGHYCGATALSLSMHTHLIATSVWQYRQGMPVAPMLERVAAEELFLATSSASDWLDSGGVAERVEGGYRISVRKHFVSGSPAGDLLVTSAVYDDPDQGPTVLHFATPMKAEGISVGDNWRTMSMRPSGSNDVVLEQVFVPDAAVSSRRPRGAWPPMFNVVGPVALPLIMSVYLGVAEAARNLTLEQVARKREDENTWYLLGEMEDALVAGRLAVDGLTALCADYAFVPDIEVLNQALVYKTIAAGALETAVARALEAVGGGGIFRTMGLERLFRDMQAARFHPLQTKRQHRFTGRLMLGLDPVG